MNFKPGFYGVYVCEGYYGGLHGINDVFVDHFNNLNELEDTCVESGYQLYETYCEQNYPSDELELDMNYCFIGSDLTEEHRQLLDKEIARLGYDLFREEYEIK